jgi:hypothetical protein
MAGPAIWKAMRLTRRRKPAQQPLALRLESRQARRKRQRKQHATRNLLQHIRTIRPEQEEGKISPSEVEVDELAAQTTQDKRDRQLGSGERSVYALLRRLVLAT